MSTLMIFDRLQILCTSVYISIQVAFANDIARTKVRLAFFWLDSTASCLRIFEFQQWYQYYPRILVITCFYFHRPSKRWRVRSPKVTSNVLLSCWLKIQKTGRHLSLNPTWHIVTWKNTGSNGLFTILMRLIGF